MLKPSPAAREHMHHEQVVVQRIVPEDAGALLHHLVHIILHSRNIELSLPENRHIVGYQLIFEAERLRVADRYRTIGQLVIILCCIYIINFRILLHQCGGHLAPTVRVNQLQFQRLIAITVGVHEHGYAVDVCLMHVDETCSHC